MAHNAMVRIGEAEWQVFRDGKFRGHVWREDDGRFQAQGYVRGRCIDSAHRDASSAARALS